MTHANIPRRCVPAAAFVLSTLAIARSARIPAESPLQPTLEQVLQLAGQYVVDYGSKMTAIVATERYTQRVELTGTGGTSNRTLVSQFALVRTGNRWTAYRDAYEVDGRQVGDRKDRLEKLLVEPSAAASTRARELADETAQYNVGPILRSFNTPTMALYFLQPEMQARFKYKKAGEEQVEGAAAWKVHYQESVKPSIIVTSAGKDMPVSGTFWINPANGMVLRSEMMIETEGHIQADSAAGRGGGRRGGGGGGAGRGRFQSSAHVIVTYTRSNGLDFLVPSEMRETYEGANQGMATITCRATYEDVRRIERSSGGDAPRQPRY